MDTTPIIRISNLSKSYNKKKVLNNINLEVQPGQVIGYIGPNGTGKSTTVRILIGLDSKFDGNVFIDNINVREDPLAVKRIIGYIPEIAEIYDVLSPMEYLKLIGRLHDMDDNEIEARGISMLDNFGMSGNLHQRMDTFSKGMKQKVLIVAGLIHNPKIIFMDEPLTGLDANTVIMLKEIIARLAAQGKTIFYCSHMMDVVERVSDRIVLLKNGSVVADGSFEELQKQGTDSLESIFSQLTGNENGEVKVDGFINSITSNDHE